MSKSGGYFKIVKTVNNGKSELSVVPSRWEKNGILYWPTKAAGTAALLSIEDPHSVPGNKGWSKHKCIVQRRNIKWDSEAAENEVKKMLDKTDINASSSSECENTKKPLQIPKKRMRRHVPPATLKSPDEKPNKFNDVPSTMTASQPQSKPVILEPEILTTPRQSLPPPQHLYVPQYNNDSYMVPSNVVWTPQPAPNPIDGVNLANITAILKSLTESVVTLNTKFENLNKKVDRLMELAETQNSPASPPVVLKSLKTMTYLPSPVVLKSLKTMMKPIDTIDDLCEFETKLKNKKFSGDLIEKLKHVCGENSMRGHNAAYTLVDKIFSRKLMTQLSWSGGFKKGTAPKTALKKFENVLNFFYILVKISDPSYTESDVKDFFKKKVLQNSVRRNSAPAVRASRIKSRRYKNEEELYKNIKTKHSKNLDNLENSNSAGDNSITITAAETTTGFADETNDCDDGGSDGDNEMKSEEECSEEEFVEEFLLGDDQIYAELIKAEKEEDIAPPHKRKRVK